jgi:hypothetical protein
MSGRGSWLFIGSHQGYLDLTAIEEAARRGFQASAAERQCPLLLFTHLRHADPPIPPLEDLLRFDAGRGHPFRHT